MMTKKVKVFSSEFQLASSETSLSSQVLIYYVNVKERQITY